MAPIEINPCVFIQYNKIPWDGPRNHRFTVDKELCFIGNEFRDYAKR